MPAHQGFDPDADEATRPDAAGDDAAMPFEPESADAVNDDEEPSFAAEAAAVAPVAPVAGSWLPPSTVQRPINRPATPYPASARPEAIAASRPTPAPFTPSPSATPQAPGAAVPPPVRPGEAPLLADLPLDAPSDLPGWLVLVGGGVGSVAFLLPWAPLVFDFYWDSWGLASVARLLVFLLVLVTAVLAIVPNRIGPWFRTGVLGLVAGGVALGLVLPYLFGAFAVPFGVLVEAVAAILLIVGGAIAVAPRRARGEPPAA